MWNSNILFDSFCFVVTKAIRQTDAIIFHVKSRRKTADCIRCNHRTHRVHGARTRTISHGTILSKRCTLVVYQRRFICQHCRSIFSEPIEFAAKYQRTTPKHKREVIFNLSDRSFSSGTKRYQISYHTQVKWLNELISGEVCNFRKEEQEATPFVLGIDEVSFAGHQMLTTIGNITKHRLKGVLTSKNKQELKKMIRLIPPQVKSKISEVVIDMCELYLFAVEETLPHVEVVVDHFHVIQDANRKLDEERRLLQDIYKKRIPRWILTKNKEDLKFHQIPILEVIMKQYPELKMYWETKERLRSMYDSKDRKEAEERLRLIISTLTSTDDGVLIAWGRLLSYWKKHILNYWNNKSTNGFMEGMHNKMKLIKRISFGFRNKQVFIHKVMLSVLIATLLFHNI